MYYLYCTCEKVVDKSPLMGKKKKMDIAYMDSIKDIWKE